LLVPFVEDVPFGAFGVDLYERWRAVGVREFVEPRGGG